MGVITLVFRSEDLTRLRTEYPMQMEIAKTNIARKVQSQGQALVHEKLGIWQTGKLAKSLVAYPTVRGMEIKIGSGIDYADIVLLTGAPKHWIYPGKGKKALSWTRFGMRIAFGAVEHPGQPARHDILDALEELVTGIIEAEIVAALRAISMAGAS